MGENVFYTKGDKETTIKRVNQVHTITLYCPRGDYAVQCLENSFKVLISKYQENDNVWENVPATDVLKCFMYIKSFIGDDVDLSILSVILSALKAFPKLKRISFEFSDDPEILDTYKELGHNNNFKTKNNIYKVDTLEFNLTDMFSQEIIDFFNKTLIHNELISNNYLERSFRIDFKFDEYISFMDMFLGNNGPYLNRMDENICDYFRTFPDKLETQKPDIRIITNYYEL